MRADGAVRGREDGEQREAWASRREIVGWGMFDFANQSYTLLIITVFYSVLFTQVIVGDRGESYQLGNFLWSLSLSISYLAALVSTPLLGAIMDFAAAKKRFLFASYVGTVVTTSLLYVVEPSWIVLGMVLIIASAYAYSLGESFIASFLPDLGPPEAMGRISGFGWSLGYLGALVCAGLGLGLLGEVSHENFDRVRWVGPLAGGFFLAAAIPTFAWLRERGRPRPLPPGRSYAGVAAERLQVTLASLSSFRDLGTLLVSIFFFMSGLHIVVAYAFIYGAQVIGWDHATRNLMFIVVTIAAIAGAFGFGQIQDRIGAKRTYLITLGMWIAAIAGIYATPELAQALRRTLDVEVEATHVFLVVGSLAGLSLGSSQAAARALVGVLAPRHKAGEIFGFWALAVRLAAVVGLMGVGILQVLFGLANALLLCIALFAIALAIGSRVVVERGRHAAQLADEREARGEER
jgi:MFS transporter, UMF1 family